MIANIEGLAGFTKRHRRSSVKRRPEMRLLLAGYPQTDLLTELKQWGIKMLFSVFT